MAYSFVAANSQYISAAAPATAVPLTQSAIAAQTTGYLNQTVFGLFRTNTERNDFLLAFSSGGNPQAVVDSSGSQAAAFGSAVDTTNINNIVGVFELNNSRTVFYNGNKGENNKSSLTPSGIDALFIGALHAGTYIGGYFGGMIAEAAIWNVALTDAEIASLAKGFKPTRIRPQSLVFYAPLLRNLQDIKGGLALTNNGATVADHPRVY